MNSALQNKPVDGGPTGSPEVDALLNPPFLGLVLREAVRAYKDESQHGMDYPLAHLVLPILLPNTVRSLLPSTTRTKMHVWIEAHPEALIDFAARASSLVPYTRVATLFACQRRALALDETGRLIVGPGKVGKPTAWPDDSDARDCYKRAGFLGKWLAQTGEPRTIYTMWGVRP